MKNNMKKEENWGSMHWREIEQEVEGECTVCVSVCTSMCPSTHVGCVTHTVGLF